MTADHNTSTPKGNHIEFHLNRPTTPAGLSDSHQFLFNQCWGIAKGNTPNALPAHLHLEALTIFAYMVKGIEAAAIEQEGA